MTNSARNTPNAWVSLLCKQEETGKDDRTMFNFKKILTALIVVAVLLVTAPLPRHISTTLQSPEDETSVVLLDLWSLQYLLLENKLAGTISVATPFSSTRYGEHLNYLGLSPEGMGEEQVYCFEGYRHDAQASTMYPVQIFLDQDFDRVMILETYNGVPHTQLAGRRGMTTAELQEFFAPYTAQPQS